MVALAACTLPAQWLQQPAVGIPRTPDGKPNLAAPAPRASDGKPDLSGLWNKAAGQYQADITVGMPPEDIQPWVRALYQQRIDNYAKENMGVQCVPEGPRYATKSGYLKIVQTPLLIVMLHEDLTYRQVFLDGREFPKDPQPNWMGYSIGHWEDETLVVETTGFNNRTWLDGTGHAHTESLRLTERYRRSDFGHLTLETTLEDPGAYRRAWTVKSEAVLQPDTELLEYVCKESDGGKEHFVGQIDKDRERAVPVSEAFLASYTGSYELTLDGAKLTVEVSLIDGQLMVNRGGRGWQPMVATSETSFSSPMGSWEFEKDNKGETVLVYVQVESEVRAARKDPAN